jgi:hypothetical protein
MIVKYRNVRRRRRKKDRIINVRKKGGKKDCRVVRAPLNRARKKSECNR